MDASGGMSVGDGGGSGLGQQRGPLGGSWKSSADDGQRGSQSPPAPRKGRGM